MIRAANENPIPADGYTPDPRPVTGDDDDINVNSGIPRSATGSGPTATPTRARGISQIADDSPTPLVVATTYDAATPSQGALELTEDLGNARLLTMDGDNHTAYAANSVCVDDAVNAYLLDGTLPTPGARCAQQVPFLPAELSGLGLEQLWQQFPMVP